ncbi:zf-HC2 domain-containing protein [Myxococcus landrumensis]|uniref:Zf-HC2 domain-containing protein n=1 Tax=Myxococcus landrumensis TaxID=2813577 RepID=A0ABX7NGA1_9BACT|nr:zf-HC2 domain-containing protein [Myxococcus landrumus]QSQ17847.1 zf-HC2 domain-containing protein [Myxococcus landrumus]
MLKPHLTRDSAEQYILGALAPEKAAALEAHTLECEPCAVLLQEEAILSEQLTEVASSIPEQERVLRPAAWSGRRTVTSAAIAAIAASLALVLLPSRNHQETSAPKPLDATPPSVAMELDEDETPGNVVACPDLATQDTCTRKAAERGLLVMNPSGNAEVPRYEAHTGLPEGAFNARGPVSL